jgi:N-acetylglucosaminyl-diphospho-decaprenol L-rhamnosyltransferase
MLCHGNEWSGPQASKVDVSVIVVTHNNEAVIEQCLQAVQQSFERYSAELFLVDNASSDRTVQRASMAAPEAQIMKLEQNLGFAVANNLAIEKAAGRFIALINADAFPDPGTLDRLLARADTGGVGIVGGRLRYPSGRLQPSAGRFPSIARNLGTALFLHRLPGVSRLRLSILANPRQYMLARRVDWVSAAFCVAKREVGPLPTNGFMYGEDVEWAQGALAKGLETWIEPAGTAIHLRGGGSDAVQAAQRRQLARLDFDLRWFRDVGRPLWAVRMVAFVHATLRILMHAVTLPVRPNAARRGIMEHRTLMRAALRISTVDQRGEADSE